jgi:hypothetical protein
MKLSAPVSSIFLLQPCRAYRHDLDETGLLILGCWFEPTPATDAARSGQCRKPGTKSPARRVRWAEPKNKRRSVETSSHHWTGDGGVDGRQPKPEVQPRPCPVGLNQHVLGLAPGCDVRNGRNDETEPKPRDAGRGRAPRGTRPKAKKFGSEGRAQGIPAEPA